MFLWILKKWNFVWSSLCFWFRRKFKEEHLSLTKSAILISLLFVTCRRWNRTIGLVCFRSGLCSTIEMILSTTVKTGLSNMLILKALEQYFSGILKIELKKVRYIVQWLVICLSKCASKLCTYWRRKVNILASSMLNIWLIFVTVLPIWWLKPQTLKDCSNLLAKSWCKYS